MFLPPPTHFFLGSTDYSFGNILTTYQGTSPTAHKNLTQYVKPKSLSPPPLSEILLLRSESEKRWTDHNGGSAVSNF